MGVLCIFLCIACYFDYRSTRIPNWLIAFILIYGMLRNLLTVGWKESLFLIACFAAWMCAFYPLYKIGVLGAGDVKLYSVCAIYFHFSVYLKFLFFSMLFSAMLSLWKMVADQNGIERIRYFCEYLQSVYEKKAFQLYFTNEAERMKNSICLAGPVLISLLLHVGGVY